MQIPQIEVLITQGNRQLSLIGAIDTGYTGLAVIRPSVQSRLGMPVVGSTEMLGFGGKVSAPLVRADSLAVKGSPACAIPGAVLTVSEIPGSGPEDVLFGESFFKQFAFDINYREGQPVIVACGRKVETVAVGVSDFFDSLVASKWFVPAVAIGLGGLAIGAYALFSSGPAAPEQQRS